MVVTNPSYIGWSPVTSKEKEYPQRHPSRDERKEIKMNNIIYPLNDLFKPINERTGEL
jgi:hypothetical protein